MCEKLWTRPGAAGGQRAALRGPLRLAPPFRHLARTLFSPARGTAIRDRPEATGQRPRPAVVAVARRNYAACIGGVLASLPTRPRQRIVEFATDQLFDEFARPGANLGPDRIEPVAQRSTAILAVGCAAPSGVVVLIVAWFSVRRFNAG